MWLLESARLTLQRFFFFFIVSAPFTLDTSCDTLPFYHHSILTIFGRKFPLISFLSVFFFWVHTGEVAGYQVKMDATVLFHLLAQSTMLGPVESLSGCICFCPSSSPTAPSFVMFVRWSNYSLHLFWECDTGTTFLCVQARS